jgi:hypothetical protein
LPTKQFSTQISDNEIESDVHSFVIKIWLDDKNIRRGTITWRGHITHVADARRQYVQRLVNIVTFILPYLQEMGVQVSMSWRFIQWISRSKQRSTPKGRSNDERDH